MKVSDDHLQARQRLKVGLIGLASVILLIGIASAMLRTARHDAPIGAAGAARPEVVASIANSPAPDAGGEPMAELGLGTTTGNRAAAAPR